MPFPDPEHLPKLQLVKEYEAVRLFAKRAWLAYLDEEQDNLTEALRLTAAHQDAATGLRLSVALVPYWFQRDGELRCLYWLRNSLALPGATDETLPARAKALVGIQFMGRFSAITVEPELLAECENIYQSLGDRTGLAFARCLAYHPKVPPTWSAQLRASLPELLALGEHLDRCVWYVLTRRLGTGEWKLSGSVGLL